MQQAVGYENPRSRKKLELEELGVTSIEMIVYEAMGLWLSVPHFTAGLKVCYMEHTLLRIIVVG